MGRELHIADVATVIAAVIAYGAFLLAAGFRRLGRGTSPLLPFNRSHLRFSALYLAVAALGLAAVGANGLGKWTGDLSVGAFFYFGLHYAIFLNFFGMAKASVSTSIISIVYRKGGSATREEIVAAYAGGEGFEYIKQSRLARLEVFLRWVERTPGSEQFRVTEAGLKAIRTTRFFLKTWSLTQLGGKQ